jgi:hypothetical protein
MSAPAATPNTYTPPWLSVRMAAVGLAVDAVIGRRANLLLHQVLPPSADRATISGVGRAALLWPRKSAQQT